MNRLSEILHQMDGKGYKAYKTLTGSYPYPSFVLYIDYVQGDPFASPSKIRIKLPLDITEVKNSHIETQERKVSCEDLIAREVSKAIVKLSSSRRGSGKSGQIYIDTPGQEVLERSAVSIKDQSVEICLSLGLPAYGRKIAGKEATKLFFEDLPSIVEETRKSLTASKINDSTMLSDQQSAIRAYLEDHECIAFIGNGSILPRESGISNRPLQQNVVPFQSPSDLELSIPIPHREAPIKGMGIRKGVTLIVGGGYHGKSTLLQAIERGVYNHIKGDGREFVITDPTAVKIKAEDGRPISGVDISPFISNLPFQKETNRFSSLNASGSTSQAAAIMESLECQTNCLLIDEDTSATNFMIRDSRMQALVAKEKEPITPFVDKVKQLYQDYRVSTILVMGGSGEYFDVANHVIMMDEYTPYDVTEKAKDIANKHKQDREKEGGEQFGNRPQRVPLNHSLRSKKGKKHVIKTRGRAFIQYGTESIHLVHVEQLVDDSQTRLIADILYFLERNLYLDGEKPLFEIIKLVDKKLTAEGIRAFSVYPDQHPGDIARPRMIELAAALNRLPTLKIKK